MEIFFVYFILVIAIFFCGFIGGIIFLDGIDKHHSL